MSVSADGFRVCRTQLENLAMLVEQQRCSGLRERAAFLVLTRTLLLGLGELSETQHLLTAQRVYALLERPLLEVIRSDASQVGRPLTSRFPPTCIVGNVSSRF